jgi:3-hydroxyisobutyrate dehydrogenase-like beta-hydroxyacid dehydrogenase
MTKSVAYIGAGLMGGPMVKRLAAKGYAVCVYDIVAERMTEAAAAGARTAKSPAAAIEGAELVVLNLPTPKAVEDAVFGKDGVASRIKPPALLVDFSTIEVERGRGLAMRLKDTTGCHWIDAPVSGGPVASGNGTLTVMAGGEPADIEKLRPFFADVSANFTHVGPTGDGLVAKMVSQLIVACLHVVLAEGARLAELCGIDAKMIPSCVKGGHADGELLRQLYPRIAERDFKPRAYARQLAKDLHMLEDLAGSVGLEAPMLREAHHMYQGLVDRGFSELDVSAVIKMYETAGPA